MRANSPCQGTLQKLAFQIDRRLCVFYSHLLWLLSKYTEQEDKEQLTFFWQEQLVLYSVCFQ